MLFNKRSLMNKNITLHPFARGKKNIPYKKPYIVITFDDGYESDYTVAYTEMSQRGMKGTSYICPGKIPSSSLLNWTQINTMYNSGWDFQCHTYTHNRVTELTEQELRDNMINVNNAFISNGLPAPQHHAYPFGSWDEISKDIISEYRLTQRRIGYNETAYNEHETIFPQLVGFSSDTAYGNINHYKEVIDFIHYVRNYQKIGVLYFHKITDSEDAGMYKQYFIDYLNEIDTLGIEVVTISELYNMLAE